MTQFRFITRKRGLIHLLAWRLFFCCEAGIVNPISPANHPRPPQPYPLNQWNKKNARGMKLQNIHAPWNPGFWRIQNLTFMASNIPIFRLLAVILIQLQKNTILFFQNVPAWCHRAFCILFSICLPSVPFFVTNTPRYMNLPYGSHHL